MRGVPRPHTCRPLGLLRVWALAGQLLGQPGTRHVQSLARKGHSSSLCFVQVEAAQKETVQLRIMCDDLREKNLEMG